MTKKRILNCDPSTGLEKDWQFNDAVTASFATKAKALPESVDLRSKWWDIADQGDTGSCVGQATADGLLRWHFVQAKMLKQAEKLSVRFIWMSAKETDEFKNRPSTFIESEGTSLKAALDIARKFGCVKDAELPFGSGKLYQGEERTLYALASRYKIKNYFNLVSGNKNKLLAWKQWLAGGNGPILTRLECDDTWMNALKTKGKLQKYLVDTADGGHAVAIVGYTKDAFIIRNSWGTTQWGDKGFAYASMDYADEAFNEAYGITI